MKLRLRLTLGTNVELGIICHQIRLSHFTVSKTVSRRLPQPHSLPATDNIHTTSTVVSLLSEPGNRKAMSKDDTAPESTLPYPPVHKDKKFVVLTDW